jgi:hypothetical protein
MYCKAEISNDYYFVLLIARSEWFYAAFTVDKNWHKQNPTVYSRKY